MSKPIVITEEYRLECLKEFAETLSKMRLTDGKIQYTKQLDSSDDRAVVYFTQEAWTKMVLLIKNFDKEVAWHGVAVRGDDASKNEYIISDILVYPQEVTGATVETDQEEYETWLYELPDEVFNNLRMQGHSHVNMAVNPSGVDTTHQGKIMSQLEKDMFYIFMIWNKSFSNWIKIYDFAKNTMFETGDVSVKILGTGFDPDEFMKEARDLVKTTKVTTYQGNGSAYGSGNYGGYNGYGSSYNGYGSGYGSGYYGGGSYQGSSSVPAKKEPEKKAETKTETSEKKTNAPKTDETGWRKVNGGNSLAATEDDDDEYGYFGEYDEEEYNFGGGYSSLYHHQNDPFFARGT